MLLKTFALQTLRMTWNVSDIRWTNVQSFCYKRLILLMPFYLEKTGFTSVARCGVSHSEGPMKSTGRALWLFEPKKKKKNTLSPFGSRRQSSYSSQIHMTWWKCLPLMLFLEICIAILVHLHAISSVSMTKYEVTVFIYWLLTSLRKFALKYSICGTLGVN